MDTLLIILKELEMFHSSYYKYTLLPKIGPKLDEIKKQRIAQKKQVVVTSHSFNHFFVQTLRQIIPPSYKIEENTFVFDNLLECDVIITDPTQKKYILELFGPSHFLIFDPTTINPLSFKILTLKRSLGEIIIFPYFEWYALPNEESKKQYIKDTFSYHLSK